MVISLDTFPAHLKIDTTITASFDRLSGCVARLVLSPRFISALTYQNY